MTNPSCYIPKCEDCEVKDSCNNYPWGVGSVWETTSVPPVETSTNQDNIGWTMWETTNYGLDGECSY